MNYDLIIRQVRITDDFHLVDIGIIDGYITTIEACIEGVGNDEIAGLGRVLVSGFVESHLHLEKAYVMDRKANASGTLQEAIAVTAALKPTFTSADITERATKALRALVRNGTTHVRAHAEFDPTQGFTGLDAVLALREKYKDIITIQVVAFPQEGIIKAEGTKEMMYEAMMRGADVVGGIPYNDSSAKEHIDFVFELAKEFDKDIDLHQDFSDNADSLSIEYVANKTIEQGWQGRVSVGHLTALDAVNAEERTRLISLIKAAEISVMCLPATDMHLGARGDEYSVRRMIAPVRALRDGGVNVCLATNNIQNAFTPFSTGNLLHISMLAIPACHLGGADDQKTILPMLTYNPAKALGLKDYGVGVGKRADLVLLDCEKVSNVVIDIPNCAYVLKGGSVVSKNDISSAVSF
ncbi:amidohydrolase family protein [Photobacterium sp.]|uniref:amidohydrolase family protein n=1 Tax=Photobacterium sp. TaxID=660 RepID=UPI00299D3983|nr:amidohydrolase family protein [Photobacterium sp.]MDX1301458.1 amidohydrolase family protein [Photobacterium sp.]